MTDVQTSPIELSSGLAPLTGPLLEHGLEVALIAMGTWVVSRLLQVYSDRVTHAGSAKSTWLLRAMPLLRIAIWAVGLGLVVTVLLSTSLAVFVMLTLPFAVGLGLASRDLIRNLIAGIIIGFDRDFEIGDVIRTGEIEGEVTGIGLRAIRIMQTDGHAIEVPNAYLLRGPVSNVTPALSDAQTRIEITLPGHTEVARARQIAYLAAAVSRYASPRRAPEVFVDTPFDGEFLVRLTVLGFVFDPVFEDHYRSDVIEMIREQLAAQSTPRVQ